jgi:DNA-binding CsgD family transcriptional regulator
MDAAPPGGQHLWSFASMAMLRSLPNLAMRTPAIRDSHTQGGTSPALEGNDSTSSPAPSNRRPYHLLIAGFEALDLVNIGLVVTSASGQLLLANRTAEEILKLRDGIEIGPTGLVRTSLKCTPNLNALMDAVMKARGGARDSVLPVRRPSGKRPLTAIVRAVEGTAPEADPLAPATLLFILDPENSVDTVEAELRQLYGLTSMEACLANLLMAGKALDECCKLLNIRRSTARTHLQHLFEKVGVQRQSELVSLLLKSIGLVGAMNKPVTNRGARKSTV